METPTRPEDSLPLTPATFLVLMALSGGPQHGYAILRAVEEESDGSVRLGPGTLYTALAKLLAQGWIEELAARQRPRDDDERRRYYRLTALGRRIAAAEAARLDVLVRRARTHRLLRRPGTSP